MAKDDRRKWERRRQKRRKYGQAQLKHSKRGIISCVMAGIVLLLEIILLAIAYKKEGNTASYIGGLGLVAVAISGTGLYMAIRGLKERNKNKLTCKIGVGVNAAILLGFVTIFCRGLF